MFDNFSKLNYDHTGDSCIFYSADALQDFITRLMSLMGSNSTLVDAGSLFHKLQMTFLWEDELAIWLLVWVVMASGRRISGHFACNAQFMFSSLHDIPHGVIFPVHTVSENAVW